MLPACSLYWEYLSDLTMHLGFGQICVCAHVCLCVAMRKTVLCLCSWINMPILQCVGVFKCEGELRTSDLCTWADYNNILPLCVCGKLQLEFGDSKTSFDTTLLAKTEPKQLTLKSGHLKYPEY